MWLSLSGFVLKAASCGAASKWGAGEGGIPGLLVPMCSGISRQTECKGTPTLAWAPQDPLPKCVPPTSLCVLSSAPHPPPFYPPTSARTGKPLLPHFFP